MEITITLGELFELAPVLRKISEQKGMSVKTNYHIAKLMKLVGAELKIFNTEREKLFVELGIERDSKTPEERRMGPTVREIVPKALPEFRRRLEELTVLEVKIPYAPLKSTDLTQATASDFVDLGPLCELLDPPGE